jgi:hypothetical protein
MTNEQQHDLHEISAGLAYEAIKFSPLFRSLENDQMDTLAEEIAKKLDARLAVLIDEEIDKVEAAAA